MHHRCLLRFLKTSFEMDLKRKFFSFYNVEKRGMRRKKRQCDIKEKRKKRERNKYRVTGNSSRCLPWDNIEMAACGTNRCSCYYKTRLNCERTAPRRWDYVDVLAWDRWIDARSLSFTCLRPRSARFSWKKPMQTAPRCKKFQEQHVSEILGAFTQYSSINFTTNRQISRADCKGLFAG